MARLEAILMCDTIVVAPDGKMQLQGIFDRIRTAALPASHRIAWVYFRFLIDNPKGPYTMVQLGVSRPGGFTEKMGELKVAVAPDGRVEGNVALQNFPIQAEGYHAIDLFHADEKVGSYRFAVELVKSAVGGKPHNASIN